MQRRGRQLEFERLGKRENVKKHCEETTSDNEKTQTNERFKKRN